MNIDFSKPLARMCQKKKTRVVIWLHWWHKKWGSIGGKENLNGVLVRIEADQSKKSIENPKIQNLRQTKWFWDTKEWESTQHGTKNWKKEKTGRHLLIKYNWGQVNEGQVKLISLITGGEKPTGSTEQTQRANQENLAGNQQVSKKPWHRFLLKKKKIMLTRDSIPWIPHGIFPISHIHQLKSR